MGITKSEIFSLRQNRLARMLKALAHPARIAILEHLLRTESCITADIVGELGLAQATVSQHLRELRELGIIKGCVEGTSVCYCIDHRVWQQVRKELGNFLDLGAGPGKCC
jgi:DNA-binding transcriptional ArsR family regulator